MCLGYPWLSLACRPYVCKKTKFREQSLFVQGVLSSKLPFQGEFGFLWIFGSWVGGHPWQNGYVNDMGTRLANMLGSCNCFRNNICWMWPLKLPYSKCDGAQKARLEIWCQVICIFFACMSSENLRGFHAKSWHHDFVLQVICHILSSCLHLSVLKFVVFFVTRCAPADNSTRRKPFSSDLQEQFQARIAKSSNHWSMFDPWYSMNWRPISSHIIPYHPISSHICILYVSVRGFSSCRKILSPFSQASPSSRRGMDGWPLWE